VAIFGAFLTSNLNAGLGKIMPGIDVGKLQGMGAAKAGGGGSMQLPDFVKTIITDAITGVFALGLYVVAAALLVVLFIPHLPMRDRSAMGAQASPNTDPDGDDTVIPAEAHL
jgi:hypothetical protein